MPAHETSRLDVDRKAKRQRLVDSDVTVNVDKSLNIYRMVNVASSRERHLLYGGKPH